MLELEIVPEISIGSGNWEFIIGMPLFQAIQLIKLHERIIKNVIFSYCEYDPLSCDLIIDLTQDSVKLIFDPIEQRLKTIEIYNMSNVKLKYCLEFFSTPSSIATLSQIDQAFGATHPSVYDNERRLLRLSFRGLTFFFNVDSQTEGSLHFDPSYLLTSLVIFSGASFDELVLPSIPRSCFCHSFFLQKVQVMRHPKDGVQSLHFHLITEETSSRKSNFVEMRVVSFGDTCQDVQSMLGCPSRLHYKDEDKMRIHSKKLNKKSKHSGTSDYFYNYLTLGTDILFNGKTHRVKKFILHTNFPHHFDFNSYYRCKFEIPLNASHHDLTKFTNIFFDTRWSFLRNTLTCETTKPVILNRTSEQNPFGSTHCYGYQEFIFEVMTNDHIASIVIYDRHDNASS